MINYVSPFNVIPFSRRPQKEYYVACLDIIKHEPLCYIEKRDSPTGHDSPFIVNVSHNPSDYAVAISVVQDIYDGDMNASTPVMASILKFAEGFYWLCAKKSGGMTLSELGVLVRQGLCDEVWNKFNIGASTRAVNEAIALGCHIMREKILDGRITIEWEDAI